MELNWTALTIIGIILVSLVIFLIIKNKKDRKELENQLNQDYKKSQAAEHIEDPDDVKNT